MSDLELELVHLRKEQAWVAAALGERLLERVTGEPAAPDTPF